MTTALYESYNMKPHEDIGENLYPQTADEVARGLTGDNYKHIGGIVTAAELLSTQPDVVPRPSATGKVTATRNPVPGGDSISDYDTEES